MSHTIEHVDAGASRAAKTWRDTRAKNVDESMATEELSKLETKANEYKVGERAYAEHDFHSHYVGKVYANGAPTTEVVTMAHQELCDAESALALFRFDPELFYLGVGLLRR